MNWTKKLPNGWYDILFIGIFLIGLCRQLSFLSKPNFYNDLHFYEFFFNFESGFIRRGLGGEIIFFVNDYLHIPPEVFIPLGCFVSLFVLLYIVCKLFLKNGYGLNVLILTFLFGGIVVFNIVVFRRDFLELALLGVALLLFYRMKIKQWLVVGNLIMVFATALHEATFFFTVPILILITNLRQHSIVKSTAYWLPSIAMFLVCCYFKGTPEMINPIVERAAHYCPQAFHSGEVPGLLAYIGKDATATFIRHLNCNYWFVDNITQYPFPAFIATLFYYVYVPYITIAMLRAFTPQDISHSRLAILVRIIIFQFLCLIPMFTILSCDVLRVCGYWMMSSLLVWLVLSDIDSSSLFKDCQSRVVDKYINKLLPYTKVGRLPLTMMVLLIGVVLYLRSIETIISSNLAYIMYKTAKRVISAFVF